MLKIKNYLFPIKLFADVDHKSRHYELSIRQHVLVEQAPSEAMNNTVSPSTSQPVSVEPAASKKQTKNPSPATASRKSTRTRNHDNKNSISKKVAKK